MALRYSPESNKPAAHIQYALPSPSFIQYDFSVLGPGPGETGADLEEPFLAPEAAAAAGSTNSYSSINTTDSSMPSAGSDVRYAVLTVEHLY